MISSLAKEQSRGLFSVKNHIIFLVDLFDADTKENPADVELLNKLDVVLDESNSLLRHARDGKISALVRERRWNPYDNLWMGYERKRGKIVEFCRLIQGLEGDFIRSSLPFDRSKVTNVIMMDIDSRITQHDADTLTHEFDLLRQSGIASPPPAFLAPCLKVLQADSDRWERWLIQPEVLESGSDVRELTPRQVAFGRDIYNGKAILNVDDYVRLSVNIKENTILSHDHLEAILGYGCSTNRASIYEPFPKNRADWERRLHRWMRGDFQIAPWITGHGADPSPHLRVGQWFALIHVVAAAIDPLIKYIFVVLAFSSGTGVGIIALMFVLLTDEKGIVIGVIQLVRMYFKGSRRYDLFYLLKYIFANGLLCTIGNLIYFQRNALIIADAGVRSTFRMLKGRKGLLEWHPKDSESVRRNRISQEALTFIMALSLARLAIEENYLVYLVIFWIVAPAVLARLPYSVRRIGNQYPTVN